MSQAASSGWNLSAGLACRGASCHVAEVEELNSACPQCRTGGHAIAPGYPEKNAVKTTSPVHATTAPPLHEVILKRTLPTYGGSEPVTTCRVTEFAKPECGGTQATDRGFGGRVAKDRVWTRLCSMALRWGKMSVTSVGTANKTRCSALSV